MLRPYLKFLAISSLGVRSQCLNNVKYKQKSFSFTIVVIKKTHAEYSTI